jgi:hypothetical protein
LLAKKEVKEENTVEESIKTHTNKDGMEEIFMKDAFGQR